MQQLSLGNKSRKCMNITVTWKGKQTLRGNPKRIDLFHCCFNSSLLQMT